LGNKTVEDMLLNIHPKDEKETEGSELTQNVAQSTLRGRKKTLSFKVEKWLWYA